MNEHKFEYYHTYFLRYLAASPELREASRQHWTRVHAENVLSGREDLIIFSAKMLGAIALADAMPE